MEFLSKLTSPGLSLLEFQGYVACVLTQILRELFARSAGRIFFFQHIGIHDFGPMMNVINLMQLTSLVIIAYIYD